MKKNLLSLAFGLITFLVSAQVRVCDFNDATKFPSGTTYTGNPINIANGYEAWGGTQTLTINSQSGTYTDGYNPTQRIQFGGVSYPNTTDDPTVSFLAPTRRTIKMTVNNGDIIKIWARGGGAGRKLILTNTTDVKTSYTFTGTESQIVQYTHTGSTEVIELAWAINQNSLHKIEITPAVPLSTTDIKKLDAQVFANGKKLNINNVKVKNAILQVYNMNAQLVKTVKLTANNTEVALASGIYIVNINGDGKTLSQKISIK